MMHFFSLEIHGLLTAFEAHIGGFVMGLLVSTMLYPVISETKRHKFLMLGARLVAAPLAILLFVLLVRNFYTSNPYAGQNLHHA
jgi:hypothetical protein